ncbi:hypothetical protein HPB47_024677 [Ixodes persulcatus]|uniref:Uncharacterized protein n=1 Tax=Ixodes persulcatus TaxID=34615 RepID=A0AC60Q3L1_IXOPE|nr:hypothetical protein HPB47_024677 [Ixodes persulcatus]
MRGPDRSCVPVWCPSRAHTSGSKEALIQRLAADIEARRKSSPCLDQASASAAGSLALDPITLQNLAVLLQQLPRPSTTVTTLPDLSASLPQFEGSPKQNVKEWLEDVRRVQQLASWDDATTRLIAASKLKGTARNWHLAFGSQYDTWPTWRDALKETFITEWTLIHWQERVMDVTQGIGESLHQYAFTKLRIIQRCPVTLSDPQKIDYLLQGMRDQYIVAALAANRPTTVQAFLATCTSLDRSTQHAKASPSTTPPHVNASRTCPPTCKRPGTKPSRHNMELQRFVVTKSFVGGTTVLPAGAASLKITIGPIAGVVQAAVLEHNILPFIIGEDWFRAAQARLIFEPPQPVRLQHTATVTHSTHSQALTPPPSNTSRWSNNHTAADLLSDEHSTPTPPCSGVPTIVLYVPTFYYPRAPGISSPPGHEPGHAPQSSALAHPTRKHGNGQHHNH